MTPKLKSRLFLLLVFLACASPIAASFLTYYVWQPEKLMNYGELMPLKKIPDNSLSLNGNDYRVERSGKWTLLIVDGASCAQDCQQRLYDIRQVWLALGV